MNFAKWAKRAVIVVVGLPVLGFGIFEAAKAFTDPEKFRAQIVETVKKDYGLDIAFQRLKFTHFTLGLAVISPRVTGAGIYANAGRIEASLSIWSVITGKPRVSMVKIVQPMVIVRRLPDGTWNVDPLIAKIREQKESPPPEWFTLKGGHLLIVDEKAGADGGHPPAVFDLGAINAHYRDCGWLPLALKAEAEFFDAENPGKIRLALESGARKGFVGGKRNIPTGKITFDSIDARRFGDYLKGVLPTQYLEKVFSLDFSFSGLLKEKAVFSGGLTARPPEIGGAAIISANGDKGFRRITFSGSLLPEKISLDKLDVFLPEVSLSGNFAVENFHEKNPQLSFSMSTSLIDISRLSTLTPPAYTNEPAVKFLENSVGQGKFRLTNVSFKGPYDAFVNLRDPANIGMLSGKVELMDLRLALEGIRHPIDGINGALIVADNNVRFSGIKASYGKSKLQNVTGEIDEFSSNPKLGISIDADMDLGEFRDELAWHVTSPAIKEYLQPIRNTKGSLGASFKVKMDIGKRELTALDGDLRFDKAGFTHDRYKESVEDLKGTVHITQKGISLKGISWKLAQNEFKVSGDIRNYSSPISDMNIDIGTSGDFSRLMKSRIVKSEMFDGMKGPVYASFKLAGNLDHLVFSHRADLSQADVDIKGIFSKKAGIPLVENVSGKIDDLKSLWIEKGGVSLEKGTIGFSGQVADINSFKEYDVTVKADKLDMAGLTGYLKGIGKGDAVGTLDGYVRLVEGNEEGKRKSGGGKKQNPKPKQTPSAHLTVQVEKLNLAFLGALSPVFPPLGKLELRGTAKGTVVVTLKDDNLTVNGKVSGSEVGFKTALPKPISGLSGDVELKWPTVKFNKIPARVGDSYGAVSGTILIKEEPVFTLDIDAGELNLSDAVGMESAPGPALAEKDTFSPRISLHLHSREGKLGTLGYTSLKTSFNYYKDQLEFNEIGFTAHKGRCYASGQMDMRGNQPVFTTEMKVQDVELEGLFRELWPTMDKVTGRLSADGKFSGTGLLWEDLRKTVAGEMHFKAEDGLIGQFAGLSNVFSIVNVVPIFESRTGRQKGSGLPYNVVTGSMRLKNGVGHTEDIVLEGSVVRMSAIGDFDFSKGRVNLLMGAKPFTTVDKIISNIPLAGKLLTGEQKSLIVSYYEIKGDMGDPVATSVPGESVARTVFGIFRRVLEMPGKALSVSDPKKGPNGEAPAN